MCGSVLEREITMQDLLKIISDPERVKLGNIEDKYLSDTLGRLKGTAAALVFSKSTEEVSAVMKFANVRGLPVTPRGAGTNLVGSTLTLRRHSILQNFLLLSEKNREFPCQSLEELSVLPKNKCRTLRTEFCP